MAAEEVAEEVVAGWTFGLPSMGSVRRNVTAAPWCGKDCLQVVLPTWRDLAITTLHNGGMGGRGRSWRFALIVVYLGLVGLAVLLLLGSAYETGSGSGDRSSFAVAALLLSAVLVLAWSAGQRPGPVKRWLILPLGPAGLAAAWWLASTHELPAAALSLTSAGVTILGLIGLCPLARHLEGPTRIREAGAAAIVTAFALWVVGIAPLHLASSLGIENLMGFLAAAGWVGVALVGIQSPRVSGFGRVGGWLVAAFSLVLGLAGIANSATLLGSSVRLDSIVVTGALAALAFIAAAGYVVGRRGKSQHIDPVRSWWSALPLLAVAAPTAVFVLGLRARSFGDNVGAFVVAAAGAVLVLSAVLWSASRSRSGVEHRAMHDPLTGLPNRAMFLDLVVFGFARARRARTRAAVLFIDLDGFKLINDTSGHAAGDQLLVHVATQLRSAVREEDSVSRLAGDEFAVLLPSVRDAADAAVVADKLLLALSTPCHIGRQLVVPHGSIGVSLFPDHGETPAAVVGAADAAMYAAKQAGRNRAVVAAAPESAQPAVHRVAATRLRSALTGGPDLSVRLLPVFSGATPRQAVAAEVQAWSRDSEAGWLSPSAFRRVADEAGLRPKLELWLLGQAARCAPAAADRGVRLVVPVGGRLLCDPSFPTVVGDLEAGVGLDLVLDGRFSRPGPAASAAARAARQLASADVDLGLVWNPELEWPLVELIALPVRRVIVAATELGEPATKALIAAVRSRGWTVHARGVGSVQQFSDAQDAGCEWLSGSLLRRSLEPADLLSAVRAGAQGLSREPAAG